MRFTLPRLAQPIALAAGLYAVVMAQSITPPDFVIDTGLVLVSVTAVDRDGRFVPDLRLEDFVLEDDGKPRAIENMWREDATPLTVGLIADTSGSQRRVIPQHQRTLAQFLGQVLRPQDRAFLMSIPYDVRMVVDVTHSVNELQSGLGKLHLKDGLTHFGEPCLYRSIPGAGTVAVCNTALWSAVHDAAYFRMRQIAGRKALIVLSDGMDSGSQRTLADAIQIAQRSNTPVYTISTDGMNPAKRGRDDLARLANETGGRAYRASNEKGSRKIFAEIETELRNTYILGFTRPQNALGESFHRIKIASTRRGVTVRARAGYFADN